MTGAHSCLCNVETVASSSICHFNQWFLVPIERGAQGDPEKKFQLFSFSTSLPISSLWFIINKKLALSVRASIVVVGVRAYIFAK